MDEQLWTVLAKQLHQIADYIEELIQETKAQRTIDELDATTAKVSICHKINVHTTLDPYKLINESMNTYGPKPFIRIASDMSADQSRLYKHNPKIFYLNVQIARH